MTEHEAIGAVRLFVQENFLYTNPDAVVADDDSLLRSGVVDSMGVLEVLVFLENEFGFAILDEEVTEANLGTMRAIARFVVSKTGQSAAA